MSFELPDQDRYISASELNTRIFGKYEVDKPDSRIESKLFKLQTLAGCLRKSDSEFRIDTVNLGILKDKRILDLGCGSKKSSLSDSGGRYYRTFEPWLCRGLQEIGAKPIGVDINDLSGEEFEHYQFDFTAENTLNIFQEDSFDAIVIDFVLGVWGSPTLMDILDRRRISHSEFERRLYTKIGKLVKEGGIVTNEYNFFRKENGRFLLLNPEIFEPNCFQPQENKTFEGKARIANVQTELAALNSEVDTKNDS